jgi:hypothetical protein
MPRSVRYFVPMGATIVRFQKRLIMVPPAVAVCRACKKRPPDAGKLWWAQTQWAARPRRNQGMLITPRRTAVKGEIRR